MVNNRLVYTYCMYQQMCVSIIEIAYVRVCI